MATWSKIKFYYATVLGSIGSTLAADSTATGDYLVDYIYNMLETNMWQAANTTSPVYLTLDMGAGNTADADYLVILGHNLNTIGATVTLQWSTDNFAADINDAFAGVVVTADTVYLKEFTAPGAKRYWRLKISGTLSAAPFITLAIWGLKSELDYATASFDPYGMTTKANVNMTQGGYMAGVHTKSIERSLSLNFADADSALYTKIKAWHDTSGMKNFFVAWDTANNASDVWLMRPSTSFNNPLTNGGAYRNITVNLKGRKE